MLYFIVSLFFFYMCVCESMFGRSVHTNSLAFLERVLLFQSGLAMTLSESESHNTVCAVSLKPF